jgi:RimJ/RimL family protein N-acetyltransferase
VGAEGRTLVPMGEEHLDQTLEWLADPELRAQIDSLSEPDPAGHGSYWRGKWADPQRRDFAILSPARIHVGNCGLCDIDTRRRKAELWIYLGGQRARGTGSRALSELLQVAFSELELNRVYLRVVADNPRALAFYGGLGFTREGCLRQDTFREGRFVDSIVMSILVDEHAS